MIKHLIFFLAMVVYAAAALADGDETAAAKRHGQIVLQLNWKYQFEFAGFIAAKEKGFYKDAGIDVEIRELSPGMDVVREVLEGRADYGLYSSKLQKRFVTGEPVKLIASFFKKPSMVIVARKGIRKPADLIGKRILAGVSRKDFFLNFNEMFLEQKVDISQIELAEGEYSLQPFIDGKVDAITIFLTSQLYKLDNLGIRYNIIDPSEYDDFCLQQELFTSAETARKYPKRTLAFRNASIKGWKYALKHPAEIIELIHRKYAPSKSREELNYESRIVSRLIHADLYRIGSFDKNFLRFQFERFLGGKNHADTDRLLREYLFGDSTDMSPLVLSREERDYLKKHPVIRVHNESNWPPFNFNENGEPKGFSIDYVTLLAERLGIRLEFVSGYTWNEFLAMLPSKRLDVLINVAINKERKKRIAFTRPFLHVKHAIYTNVNNQVFYSLKDLEGKKVALVRDFFIQKYIAKHCPKIEQVLVKDQLEALELLSFGKVDAVVGKQVVVDYLLRQHLISNVIATRYLEEPETVSHLALGVSRKDALLARILDKAQGTLDEKDLNRLKRKWFGINPLLDSKELLTSGEREYLKYKKEIRVCIEDDRAPTEFIEEGRARGIAVDVLESFARRLGVKLVYFHVKDHAEAMQRLRSRDCELLPAAVKIPEDSSVLLFTPPYISRKTVLVSSQARGSGGRRSQKESGMVLVGKRGDPLLKQIRKTRPSVRIVEVESYLKSFQTVLSGKADYAVTPLPLYEYYRRHHDLQGLGVRKDVSFPTELSIAVRKDLMTLFTILNKIFQVMPRETFYAINDKWTEEKIVKETDYVALLETIFIALLIIAIILIAYAKQKKLYHRIEELNRTLEERIAEELEKNRRQELFMLQQDRLAKMGEIIAMIAHQWRQPLNNLSLVNQLLVNKYRKKILDDAAIEYFTENSRKQIEQMSATIDDFRNFYKSEKEKTEFCVNDSIEKLIEMTRMSFVSDGIDVSFEADGHYEYLGYPNELAHVILNIMNNARDAFSEKEDQEAEKRILISLERGSEGIRLRICDNAGGIPEEILEKIFEPYFSTKNRKNGTGLGLYIANVIIRDHMQSRITAANTESGSCFTICLMEADRHDTE